jgi:phage/plasmid-like protein (TIGR03299 family)
MAAEVESMMYVNQAPWHGLGKRLPLEVTAADAIKEAGLDWNVSKVKMYTAQGEEIPNFYAGRRDTDGKIVGVVGERYQHVQNVDAFGFFDSIVGQGKAIYHTAGSLQEGKRIWILAKLPGDIIVGKGDVTEKFLLLCNSHDGSSPLYMFFTPTRVVCQNTLNQAISHREGKGISLRHTTTVGDRMKEAEEAIAAANKHYDAFGELAKHLASKQFNTKQLTQLVTTLFPNKEDGETTKGVTEKREKVIYLFSGGKGHDKIAGTAWAALNAVAEYADHNMTIRNVNADKKAFNVWFGGAALLKQQAHDIITQLAA